MNETESLLEFPCSFPIKAMGRAGGDFEAVVERIVLSHAQLIAGEKLTARNSGSGNYISVTMVISAESREQLDRIYQDLTDCEQVLMAL